LARVALSGAGRKAVREKGSAPVDSAASLGQSARMPDAEPPEKDRADRMLVALGHFPSRAAAQAAIAAGRVRADGQAVSKPSQILFRTAAIEARTAHPYVSRGGLKLAHALDVFGIDPAGLVCLDLGASTGGFSDVLLRRGAAQVVAVDVGHGQFDPRLAADPRVTAHEGLDARTLTRAHLPELPALIVCDASFIALEKLLPAALSLAAPGARLVALFKPQFEVGRTHVGKGGIVRDEAAVTAARARFRAFLDSAGWSVIGEAESPVTGGDGNREYLVVASRAQ
jgi:23S rRNA (cytidine1920-2'-O)/16S rRNA (cytidine1409-2'-O)-methyltransferase